MDKIFHIAAREAWTEALKNGRYLTPSLQDSGFIHASFKSQVVEVANCNFKSRSGLVLLEIDPSRLLPPVKLEDLYDEGELFPHIFGPLNLESVVRVHEFEVQEDGTFTLPSAILSTTELEAQSS